MKRRESEDCDRDENGHCMTKKRRETTCSPGENCKSDRKRRNLNCRDPEDLDCCIDGEWLCF